MKPTRPNPKQIPPVISKFLLPVVALALAGMTSSCTTLDGGGAAAIDEDARAVLKGMSDKLAGANTFKVGGTRMLDAELVAGRNVPRSARIEGAVSRPNKIAAKTTSGGQNRRFVYDGKSVTLHDVERNHYATVPGASTIDRTIDLINERWDFHPPMADLLVRNPYASLTSGATGGKVVGTESVNGTKCQRVSVQKDDLDFDIWVATKDQLPRQLVINFKGLEGSPKATLRFNRWHLNPKLDDSQFSFTPPEGAQQIEMAPMGN